MCGSGYALPEALGFFLGLRPDIENCVAFYLIPSDGGIAPKKKAFPEGHSRFRTSGGIAAGKTKSKNLCRYQCVVLETMIMPRGIV
jgi:hypothetical protein